MFAHTGKKTAGACEYRPFFQPSMPTATVTATMRSRSDPTNSAFSFSGRRLACSLAIATDLRGIIYLSKINLLKREGRRKNEERYR